MSITTQVISPGVALVTGAARRIGRAIALALAKEGWDVAVHHLHSEEEARQTADHIRALGRRAMTPCCNLADETAVKQLLMEVEQSLGKVSCVVNNASLFDYDDARTFSTTLLDKHMHINLAAPILLAQALHATTPDEKQAVVVNLLDQKLYNPNPDFLSYTLSKTALQSATTLLAQALAPKVRVVGVAPGITLASGNMTYAQFAQAHTQTPLGRSSTPEDIAAAVCFVATASAMTGSTLLVDGGQHLVALPRDVMFLTN